MHVIRVYHSGRNAEHRKRDLALTALGVRVTLIVPQFWEERDSAPIVPDDRIQVIELPIKRPGDVNRHRHVSSSKVHQVIRDLEPDLLDLHEEPYSLVTHQWLRKAPSSLPVVMYTAQNLDKRFPPPFAQWERQALRRASGMYPCSRQAASVARGKGHGGLIRVLPLGIDPEFFYPGTQNLDDPVITLGFVGRLVREKGVMDAVHVLHALRKARPARLLIVGSGPMEAEARALVHSLGEQDAVQFLPWCHATELASLYRQMHLLLAPSRSTATWVEQFGRMLVEAQACGAVVAGYASGAIPEVAGAASALVSEGDLRALSTAVQDILEDVATFERRRDAGLAQHKDASWAHVAQQTLHLYQTVLTKPVAIPGNRDRAVAEFGPPATNLGIARPSALPGLRQAQVAVRKFREGRDRY